MASLFKHIFLDTAPVIYALDNTSPWRQDAKKVFSFVENENILLSTSVITCMEYLVYPYRIKDVAAINAFWSFVKNQDVTIHNIRQSTAKIGAQIRASYPYFKAFDSLQLSVAAENGCDLFLTNDKQLCQFRSLRVVTIEQLSAEI